VVERALVVDALADLFRPALAAGERLVLAATHIDVVVLASVARVAITRRFANGRGAPIEAVGALPPCVRGEVIRALAVVVAGDVYRAEADARTNVADGAAAARAIIHYPIDDLLQLIAIDGIPGGAEVSVRVESERALDTMGASLASLVIQLGDDHGRITPVMPGRNAAVPAVGDSETTLSITADGVQVTVQGRPHLAASGAVVAIDAAPRVVLGLAARDGRTFAAASGDASVAGLPASGTRFRFPGAQGAGEDLASLRTLALEALLPPPHTPPSNEPPVEPPRSTLPEAPYLIKPGDT